MVRGIFLFLCFGFAVDAAVFAGFLICQFEDMRDLLFDRCDTARVVALDDICQFFGQLRVEFFHTSAVFDDIDCYVRVDIAQNIQIQI